MLSAVIGVVASVAALVLAAVVCCKNKKISELENSLNRKHEACMELEKRNLDCRGDLTSLRAMRQYFDDWLDEMPQFLMTDFIDRQRMAEEDANEIHVHEQ